MANLLQSCERSMGRLWNLERINNSPWSYIAAALVLEVNEPRLCLHRSRGREYILIVFLISQVSMASQWPS